MAVVEERAGDEIVVVTCGAARSKRHERETEIAPKPTGGQPRRRDVAGNGSRQLTAHAEARDLALDPIGADRSADLAELESPVDAGRGGKERRGLGDR